MSQPTYLKNLKAYTRIQFGTGDDTTALLENLRAESDRGAVILAASGLEDILEWAIVAKMPGLMLDPSAKDAMFGGNGSLATFSSKIAMAFALGIIDRQMRNDIDVIREMRNACAHSRMPISFEQADLQAACKRILSEELSSMTTHEPKALREVFVIKTVMMQETVLTGERRVFKDEVARLAHARALAEALKTSPKTSQKKPPRRSNPGDPPQD